MLCPFCLVAVQRALSCCSPYRGLSPPPGRTRQRAATSTPTGVSRSVVIVAATAAFPVAAYRSPGAEQASVLEQVTANALHRRRLPRRPRPGTGEDDRPADCGNERVAGGCAGRQVPPRDRGAWMLGQGKPCVGVGDLDVHLHRRLGGEDLQQLADGGQRGLVTGEQEGRRIDVDRVAAPGSRDRRRVARLACLRPL